MNIEDFENGQPISCDEPPMACRIFPDNCFCRTVEMRKREDGNSSFVPMEKTVKKWNQHKIKSFEQLILRK